MEAYCDACWDGPNIMAMLTMIKESALEGLREYSAYVKLTAKQGISICAFVLHVYMEEEV